MSERAKTGLMLLSLTLTATVSSRIVLRHSDPAATRTAAIALVLAIVIGVSVVVHAVGRRL